jgi:hypothetical protein
LRIQQKIAVMIEDYENQARGIRLIVQIAHPAEDCCHNRRCDENQGSDEKENRCAIVIIH